MPLRTTTRMSDPPADLGYQKPILDFGNALNLNVSDGVSAIGMSRRGYSPSSGRLKVGTKPKSSWPRPSRESDLPRVAGRRLIRFRSATRRSESRRLRPRAAAR